MDQASALKQPRKKRMTLDDLAIMAAQGFEQVHQKFADIDAKFKLIDKRFYSVLSQIDSINSRLETVESRLDRIDLRLDGLDSRMDAQIRESSRCSRKWPPRKSCGKWKFGRQSGSPT